MTESDRKPVAPEAVAEYRKAVTDLVAKCIKGVREFPVPAEVEPLEAWKPADE